MSHVDFESNQFPLAVKETEREALSIVTDPENAQFAYPFEPRELRVERFRRRGRRLVNDCRRRIP